HHTDSVPSIVHARPLSLVLPCFLPTGSDSLHFKSPSAVKSPPPERPSAPAPLKKTPATPANFASAPCDVSLPRDKNHQLKKKTYVSARPIPCRHPCIGWRPQVPSESPSTRTQCRKRCAKSWL
ncbi:hypothetical protein TRIATDRAFT_301265, partial [Trichoderma atroviride IMI 206040]